MNFNIHTKLVDDDVCQNSTTYESTTDENIELIENSRNLLNTSITPSTCLDYDNSFINPFCFSIVEHETSDWDQYNTTMQSMDNEQLFLWQLEEEERYDQNVRECITHGRNYPIPPAPKHESEVFFNSSYIWDESPILESESTSNLASLTYNSYMMRQFSDQMQCYKERISKEPLDLQQRKHP